MTTKNQTDNTSTNNRLKQWLIIGSVVLTLVFAGLYFGIKAVIDSGITKGPDHMFGDQHLKTAVALIELHKTRYGKYPAKMSDLKFLGQWDKIHTNSVYYLPNADLTAYYVEVETGWAGKPKNLEFRRCNYG